MSRAELVQALRAAIALRIDDDGARTEIATLDAAIEIIEQEPIVCDAYESGGCAGPVYQRVCADCGHSIARCDAHRGRKSVSRRMQVHHEEQHRRPA